jgi:YVTN family beta-propeller protein
MSRLFAVVAFLALVAAHGAIAQPAYVLNGNQSVSVIDTATDTLVGSPIPLPSPQFGSGLVGVAVSPDGCKVYVLYSSHPGAMQVLDTTTRSVIATIVNWHDPEGIAVSPDGSKIYVTAQQGGVTVLNATTYSFMGAIAFADDATGSVASSLDGSKLFITGDTDTGGVVWVATTANNAIIATIPVGVTTPFVSTDIALSPNGSKVYVTGSNGSGTAVWVISTTTNAVVATIPVGQGANAVAVSSDGSKVYVANQTDNTVSVINAATATVIGNIPVGNAPKSLAITPDGTKVFVANFGDGTVSVIATTTNTVVATMTGFSGPVAIAIATPSVQSAPKSGHSCNGVYSGIFNGSIHVLAGQSCTFINGGQITGSVRVEGNFVLQDAMVGGVVGIESTGTFKIGPAAMLGSSLIVEATVPGSTSWLCGATIAGATYYMANGANMQIGSANPLLCAGNRFGQQIYIAGNSGAILAFNNSAAHNMRVMGNTGPLDVVNNVVSGIFVCLHNTDPIMLGGNKAPNRGMGQCS